MRIQTVAFVLIIAAIGAFLWISIGFDFYQDDAYITYRYVDNYLGGDGLVFNVGERVEGYTNFGWLLFLLLGGVLGFKYILLSKITGLIFGAALIVITYVVTLTCFKRDRLPVILVPVLLVALCPSLAYWAQAGLETAAFACLSAIALLLFVKRSWLLVAALTFAVLVRPEGALLAILFVLIESVTTRRWPHFAFRAAVMALVCSLPFVGFKLIYYGSILPNPFYAKTGFDWEQILAGWEYAERFFTHYPVLGVALMLAAIFWSSMTRPMKEVWLFGVLFCLYVVLIGGDVLKVHRFFLPALLPLAIAAGFAIARVTSRLGSVTRPATVVLITACAVSATIILPQDFIAYYERAEKALTHKMAFLAQNLRRTDPTDFSLAASTIGALSYNLPGHRVIDMLGLTDTTVARHPEPAIDGIESSWRERGYNSPYLLASAPDYITFSTGLKPSAPAERALLLYQQFQDCYRSVSWHYEPPAQLGKPVVFPVFKKRHPPTGPFEVRYPAEFVNSYNNGINNNSSGRYQQAEIDFQRALQLGGDRPYAYLSYFRSVNYFRMEQIELGSRLQNELVARDSMMAEPQADLYLYEYVLGDRAKAAVHRRWLAKLVPWRLPEFDSLALAHAARKQAQQNR